MQPVNEALMTDEEFLVHIEKVIEPQVADCGNVQLRAATIGRLCTMIRARDKAMHLQLQTARTTFARILDANGDSAKPSTVDDYLNLRKQVERKHDGTHEVTLSIVNVPCGVDGKKWSMGDEKTKIFLKTTREELTPLLDKIVLRGAIGETDQNTVRQRVRLAGAGTDFGISEYSKIDPANVAGVLLGYQISGIRDGSGALVITGNVRLTPEAAAMMESGNYVFGIRSTVSMDGLHRVIDELHAFDMFPVHELNTSI
ncbi:hypothetical protein OBP_286 [Pseudomonas phage OBP]|uniref:hypothetical protein n=1 Tax=Pseudomonas phage OBP TaxID=1124849 RepID=UPI000240D639|nr:hypothetical protein OBP_286 [Pseudomonas phage OBP]AEV89723.1 hypothetical protein OBP_286 [Pseudomonas phage OBP]